eukprot:GHVU01097394.1.p1 GENE.GHVU01097394.1~~GHVU01097394.1.p1  ORF type:complete len:133 (-),score=6.75 GHVU01097394.1:63-461(-)
MDLNANGYMRSIDVARRYASGLAGTLSQHWKCRYAVLDVYACRITMSPPRRYHRHHHHRDDNTIVTMKHADDASRPKDEALGASREPTQAETALESHRICGSSSSYSYHPRTAIRRLQVCAGVPPPLWIHKY